ncbi:MAG TPA: hypothetical protein VGD88_00860 [Opitutaceae bacterium]
MLFLAASALEKASQLPKSFWVNVVMAIGGLLIGIILFQHAARMNKLVLTLIIFLLVTVVGFQWIFERNEPRFLTPTIDKIAPYFPSKINYAGKQSGGPS